MYNKMNCQEHFYIFMRKLNNNTALSYERNVVLYAVRCLKSNEDMILALTGQFKQLSHEPEKFR